MSRESPVFVETRDWLDSVGHAAGIGIFSFMTAHMAKLSRVKSETENFLRFFSCHFPVRSLADRQMITFVTSLPAFHGSITLGEACFI